MRITGMVVATAVLVAAHGWGEPARAEVPAAAEVERSLGSWVGTGVRRVPCGGSCVAAPPRWRFTLAPYVWATRVTGTVAADGDQGTIDVPFGDLVEHVSGALYALARVERGRWSLALDVNLVSIEDETTANALRRTVESNQLCLDLRLGYRVWERTLAPACGCWGPRTASLQASVGARYWGIENVMNVATLGGVLQRNARSVSEWWDPVVGLATTVDVSRRGVVDLFGDVGGFGIGGASEFTWQVGLIFGWRLGRHVTAGLGYRARNVDRIQGQGASRSGASLTLHGPVLGATIHN